MSLRSPARLRRPPARSPSAALAAALGSGLRGALAALLTGALLAAPAAANGDFGHRHPDGAALHSHALTSILAAVSAPAGATPAPRRGWRRSQPSRRALPARGRARRGVRSRAPPSGA